MINGINHITISVRDIDSAFRFYKAVLGLVPIMKSSRSAYFLAGTTWLALNQETKHEPSKSYGHIAFDSDVDSFSTFVARVRASGVVEWQANTTEGESLYFLDDSGNKLEIHASSLEARVLKGKAEWGQEVVWYV